MVEDVEDFSPTLNPQLLSDVSILEDREVDIVITRPTQRVSTKRSEVPRAGNTRSRTAITGGIKRAGHFERREIDEIVRRTRASIRITDEIRSREKLARVVVIVKQREVKRIARANRHHRVHLPTLPKPRM